MTALTNSYYPGPTDSGVKELKALLKGKIREQVQPPNAVLSGFLSLVMNYGVTEEALVADLAIPGIDTFGIYLLENGTTEFSDKINKRTCLIIMQLLLLDKEVK